MRIESRIAVFFGVSVIGGLLVWMILRVRSRGGRNHSLTLLGRLTQPTDGDRKRGQRLAA